MAQAFWNRAVPEPSQCSLNDLRAKRESAHLTLLELIISVCIGTAIGMAILLAEYLVGFPLWMAN
jgi:hypothetical protein